MTNAAAILDFDGQSIDARHGSCKASRIAIGFLVANCYFLYFTGQPNGRVLLVATGLPSSSAVTAAST